MLASLRTPAIIAPASRETTSALTSPSTMSQIMRTCSSIGRPSLAISDGLVVTPSTIPQLAPFFNSSRFAVSKKNFTSSPPCPSISVYTAHHARIPTQDSGVSRGAFEETLAAGLPLFYLDDEGLNVMEQPDGRRFEIGWIPGAPSGENYEVLREVKLQSEPRP